MTRDLVDLAVAGHRDGLLKLHGLLNRGWLEPHRGFIAGVSGLPAPPFNAVTIYGDTNRDELVDALQRVSSAGLPFSLNARPIAWELAASLAREFAMVEQPDMPLMVLAAPPAEPSVPGLTLRRMSGEENERHAGIAAEAFGETIEMALALATPEMMSGQDVHFIGADWNGETVATAIADVNGESAWIYSVATLGAHRRHGFGAAVSAGAARAAFDIGASAVFLLSSPMGVGVYENLGFSGLEAWSSWVGEPRP